MSSDLLKGEIQSRYSKGELLHTLELENLRLRKLLVSAKDKVKDKKLATLYDTVNVVSSASAALRADLAMLLEEQRKLLIQSNNLEDQNLNEAVLGVGDDADKAKDNNNPVSINDDVRSHLAHSLIHNGVTHPLETIENVSYLDLEAFWEKADASKSFGNGGVKVAEMIKSNKAFLEEMSANLADADVVIDSGNSASIDVEAVGNLGFSLAMAPGSVYIFDEEDSEENIVYHSGQNPAQNAQSPISASISSLDAPQTANASSEDVEPIKAATLHKLIEKLTSESYTDLNLRYVFMLTYQSFSNPEEVLDRLEKRYYVPSPPNATPNELEYWRNNKLAPIQIKVFAVLKYWIMEHFEDFRSPEVLSKLKDLIKGICKNNTGPWSEKSGKYLLTLIERKEKGEKIQLESRANNVRPIIKQTITYREFEQNFVEHSEEEIARQICLMDFQKFKPIQPRECLNQNWSKHKDNAPNLLNMIEGFNKMTSWVQIEILSITDLNKRVKMLKKFFKIAEHLRSMNNYYALYAIHVAVNANPIFRLKKTWNQIGNKQSIKIYQEMCDLFKLDRNFMNLRNALKSSMTPCIPHIGLFLSDLTFIEEGNKDYLDGKINFSKSRKLAERIAWIKQYQQEGYNFEAIPAAQLYFERNMEVLQEDEFWTMSLNAEPKDTE